jgi:salicylate hydroxylase
MKSLTLSQWAIFNLEDHPVSTFTKGRLYISGDAAHATSPYYSAGAGLCIEDSAVIAELLADPQVRTQDDLNAVFATFNAQRRSRGQWLVQSSRWVGDCYD